MHILPPRHHPFLIAALALLLYVGTLDNAFVLDDHAAIRDNPIVHRADLSEILTTDYWSGYHADRSGLYRPLTILSYALQYRLGGDAPFGYHLLNILLHTTTALLLYRLVVDLTKKNDLALATALLFAVHPAISEAVCTAVGRADLLAAALTALSLLFAVFMTNPAPICVLDEVDAPLDDANVDRFCSLVEEIAHSLSTRFLVITHHRMTMARVDRLFGVTMGERGVSRLVSVDLKAAEKMRDVA